MDRLPNELLHGIIGHIPRSDLLSTRYVNQEYRGYSVGRIRKEHDVELADRIDAVAPLFDFEDGTFDLERLRESVANAWFMDMNDPFRNPMDDMVIKTYERLVDLGLIARDFEPLEPFDELLDQRFLTNDRVTVRIGVEVRVLDNPTVSDIFQAIEDMVDVPDARILRVSPSSTQDGTIGLNVTVVLKTNG